MLFGRGRLGGPGGLPLKALGTEQISMPLRRVIRLIQLDRLVEIAVRLIGSCEVVACPAGPARIGKRFQSLFLEQINDDRVFLSLLDGD